MQEDNQHNLDPDSQRVKSESSQTSLERRKLIKSAIASVPVVLTITAGQARAQDTGSTIDSQAPSGGGDELQGDDLLLDEPANAIPAESASDFTSEELQILNGGSSLGEPTG